MCRATTPGTRNYTVASANITVLGKDTQDANVLWLYGSFSQKCKHMLQMCSFKAPPSLVEWPESLTRPRAGTARFVCQAEGVPTPQITWLKNGEKVHSNGRIKMYNRYNHFFYVYQVISIIW